MVIAAGRLQRRSDTVGHLGDAAQSTEDSLAESTAPHPDHAHVVAGPPPKFEGGAK